MMPEAYNKLIPVPSAPTYKYSSEAAGKYIILLVYEPILAETEYFYTNPRLSFIIYLFYLYIYTKRKAYT